jgi:hypothetical protein
MSLIDGHHLMTITIGLRSRWAAERERLVGDPRLAAVPLEDQERLFE